MLKLESCLYHQYQTCQKTYFLQNGGDAISNLNLENEIYLFSSFIQLDLLCISVYDKALGVLQQPHGRCLVKIGETKYYVISTMVKYCFGVLDSQTEFGKNHEGSVTEPNSCHIFVRMLRSCLKGWQQFFFQSQDVSSS